MAKCVILHDGPFESSERLTFVPKTCAGCMKDETRSVTKSLGYGNVFFNSNVGLCHDCQGEDDRRYKYNKGESGLLGCILWVALPLATIVAALILSIRWWQALLAGVAAFALTAFVVEPVVNTIYYTVIALKWRRRHPRWPISLPVIDLKQVDIVKDGEADAITSAKRPARGRVATALVCANDNYAEALGKVYDTSAVPLVHLPRRGTIPAWRAFLKAFRR